LFASWTADRAHDKKRLVLIAHPKEQACCRPASNIRKEWESVKRLVGYPQGERKPTWEYPEANGTIMLKWIFKEKGHKGIKAFLA
jgi:hypothetical protein